MPRKLDPTILVCDLETTCWANDRDRPSGEERDIIEIGLVEMFLPFASTDWEIKNKRSILVRPDRSTISPFCTELTTITQAMIDESGVPFAEALKILRNEHNSTGRLWISWGAFDRLCFQHQCEDYGIPYKAYFSRNHINLKNLYSIMNGLPYELGMASALEREDIPLEGTHHRGHDDAANIAKIAQRMFRR